MVKKLLKKAAGNPLALFAGAIVFIALLGILLIPGFFETIGSLIFGSVNFCEDAPFDPNCICAEEFNKVNLGLTFGNHCEPTALFLDPTELNFETDALAFAQGYLTENFPECDSIACPEPGILRSDADVVFGPDHRAVYFECLNAAGKVFWELQFSLETGNVERATCNNVELPPPVGETPGTLELTLEYNSIKNGFFQARYFFDSDCVNDNGTATTTVNVPAGFIADEWVIQETGWGIVFRDERWKIITGGELATATGETCKVTNQSATSAILECDRLCPSLSYHPAPIVFAYRSMEQLNSEFCELNDIFYAPGVHVCCNSTRQSQDCQSDGTWGEPFGSNCRSSLDLC